MYQARWLMLAIAAALALQSRGDGVNFPDETPKEETQGRSVNFGGNDGGRSVRPYCRTSGHDPEIQR